MKLIYSLFMVLPLAPMIGCASEEGLTSASTDGRCTTENTSWAIGKPTDEANGRRLLRDSGASLWRIIMPKQAVPADHHDDRLTVYVDDSNVITSVSCN
ncbi:I78 family peptidase inhibitor [Pseudoxanthomonas sp. UTMC 1351]|uniref:I78 family peptidase inhibitor n=1 Tax=Pseudoxanthomonas sp. UTMC 1351 TaxID=2695853 RepID=UPI0034CE6CB1